jgi:hypothetical protein
MVAGAIASSRSWNPTRQEHSHGGTFKKRRERNPRSNPEARGRGHGRQARGAARTRRQRAQPDAEQQQEAQRTDRTRGRKGRCPDREAYGSNTNPRSPVLRALPVAPTEALLSDAHPIDEALHGFHGRWGVLVAIHRTKTCQHKKLWYVGSIASMYRSVSNTMKTTSRLTGNGWGIWVSYMLHLRGHRSLHGK